MLDKCGTILGTMILSKIFVLGFRIGIIFAVFQVYGILLVERDRL